MFIWNEERFAFNIMDAEMLKKFNDTSKEMWKELEEYEKKNATTGTIGPEGVAYESLANFLINCLEMEHQTRCLLQNMIYRREQRR